MLGQADSAGGGFSSNLNQNKYLQTEFCFKLKLGNKPLQAIL